MNLKTRLAGQAKQLASDGYHCIAKDKYLINTKDKYFRFCYFEKLLGPTFKHFDVHMGCLMSISVGIEFNIQYR